MPTPGPLPEFEDVRAELSHLWPAVYAAFESGCQDVRGWFDDRHESVNNALAHNIVRYLAIQRLEADGLHAAEDDVEREPLANNGISLLAGRYHLRFQKYSPAGVRPPGGSKILQDFYAQQLTFQFPDVESPIAADGIINLLALWEVTAAYKFVALHLACPASAGSTVTLHWGPIEIPHPAHGVSSASDEITEPDLGIEAAPPAPAATGSTGPDALLAEPTEGVGPESTAPDLDIESDGEEEQGQVKQ